MISFVRFIECLCTSDDGYIKEACKHRLHSYIYYLPSGLKYLASLIKSCAFKRKHCLFLGETLACLQDNQGDFSSVNVDTAIAIRTLEATYKSSPDATAS
ncbi:ABC transporter G family member 3 [Camellia lanceoleosa]|nr:ABC transporter G family member 3 [Camellia lanceoleosa]